MTESDNKQIELTIDKIAGMGDGVAKVDGKTVYVPLTCAGDKVKVYVQNKERDHIKATLVEISSLSPNRQIPLCRHFGKCGGCSLQHLNKQTYNDFKQNILVQIISNLKAHDCVIEPMIEVGTHSRRRLEFKIGVNKGKVKIGFFAAKTHDIIDLQECTISENKIITILPVLKKVLQNLKKPGIIKAISLTMLDEGLDVVIISSSSISESDRNKLINFAQENNIVRLCEQVQTDKQSHISLSLMPASCLFDINKAYINFANIDVFLPAGAFLQATNAGQIAITNMVTKHLKECNNIADLFSGCGTYSFPLINQAKRVSAFEGDEQMVMAMHNAILNNKLASKMLANIRDLFKNPLKVDELNNFDGIVINPPRNGALQQVKNICKSNIKKIVMVSCNTSTFKRDAKYLIANDYNLSYVVAIDQFLWTGHLEIVAIFDKT